MRLHFTPVVIPLTVDQHVTFAHRDPIKPAKKGDSSNYDSCGFCVKLLLGVLFRKGTAGPMWKSVLNVGFGRKRVDFCVVHHLNSVPGQ